MSDNPTGHPPLTESIHIDAAPELVWRIVSDVRRTGEWSPECRKVWVFGRRPVGQGSWILGLNKRGWIVWPTNSRIHRYDEGRSIGWTVLETRVQWSYQIDADGSGSLLTERRDLPEGISWVGRAFARALLGGAEVHTPELAEGMRTSLERIKSLAESTG